MFSEFLGVFLSRKTCETLQILQNHAVRLFLRKISQLLWGCFDHTSVATICPLRLPESAWCMPLGLCLLKAPLRAPRRDAATFSLAANFRTSRAR